MATSTSLNLNLLTVRVQSLSVEMPLEFEPLIPGQFVQARFAITGQRFGRAVSDNPTTDEADRLIFLTTFNFWYHHKPQPDEVGLSDLEQYPVIASIQTELGAVYSGNGLNGLDNAALQQWGARNAVLHQWPYWRELCHSTLARMGLPVTVMPLWHPPTPQEIAAKMGMTLPQPEPMAAEAVTPAPKRRGRTKSRI